MGNNDRMMGFLIGAIVGAGAALLLAPASGADTRRRIAGSTRDLADSARDLADEARGIGKDLADDARGIGKELRNRVGRVAGAIGKDAEPTSS